MRARSLVAERRLGKGMRAEIQESGGDALPMPRHAGAVVDRLIAAEPGQCRMNSSMGVKHLICGPPGL